MGKVQTFTKNNQSLLFRITVVLLVTLPSTLVAQNDLQKADSLFSAGRYTQSYDIYEKLLASHYYSPAMLLRQAYIQEGLGAPGKAVYFLDLYYRVSSDEAALRKMQELALKHGWSGYDNLNVEKFGIFHNRYFPLLSLVLSSLCLFALALLFYLKRTNRNRTLPVFLVCVFCFFLLINAFLYNRFSYAVASSPRTYVMNGPSAGAEVVAVIGEGNRLSVTGTEDAWIKVVWDGQPAFVKASQLLNLSL